MHFVIFSISTQFQSINYETSCFMLKGPKCRLIRNISEYFINIFRFLLVVFPLLLASDFSNTREFRWTVLWNKFTNNSLVLFFCFFCTEYKTLKLNFLSSTIETPTECRTRELSSLLNYPFHRLHKTFMNGEYSGLAGTVLSSTLIFEYKHWDRFMCFLARKPFSFLHSCLLLGI